MSKDRIKGVEPNPWVQALTFYVLIGILVTAVVVGVGLLQLSNKTEITYKINENIKTSRSGIEKNKWTPKITNTNLGSRDANGVIKQRKLPPCDSYKPIKAPIEYLGDDKVSDFASRTILDFQDTGWVLTQHLTVYPDQKTARTGHKALSKRGPVCDRVNQKPVTEKGVLKPLKNTASLNGTTSYTYTYTDLVGSPVAAVIVHVTRVNHSVLLTVLHPPEVGEINEKMLQTAKDAHENALEDTLDNFS